MSNATVAKLNIHLGASSTAVGPGLRPGEIALQRFGDRVSGISSRLSAILGGFAAFRTVSFGVQLAAEAETAQVAFEVMVGSAEKAKRLLDDLRQFAVRTPFEFPELRQASQTLLAMGIEVENVMGTLQTLGNLASGTNQPLNELAGLFGQVAVAGRLTGNELRQFNERGIPLMEALSKQFGVTKAEIRSMVEAGQIGFADVNRAIESMSSEGGRFFGLMDRQSQTLAGRWSTLSDSAKLAAANVGGALAPALSKLIEIAIPLVDALAAMDHATLQNYIKLGAWVASIGMALTVIPQIIRGISLIIAAYKSMASAQALLLALQGPRGWAILAGAAVIAAGSFVAIDMAFKDVEKRASDAATASDKAATSIAKIDEAMPDLEGAKKIEEAAQKMDELRRAGENLTQSLRTPTEEFADSVNQAKQLLEAGVISGETYARAMEKARDALFDSEQSAKRLRDIQAAPGTAAAERFSSAGLSAINEGRREQEKLLAQMKQQAELEKEQVRLLTEANRLAAAREMAPIRPVRL